jgi:chemotaxis protein MotA
VQKRTLIGVTVSFVLFLSSFLFTGQSGVYFNVTALLVVLSGTAGAILLSSGWAGLQESLGLAKAAYSAPQVSRKLLIAQFLRLSLKLRKNGFLRAEDRKELEYAPLAGGLELLEENYGEEEIREILGAEMHYLGVRNESGERVFRNMASFAPSFGVAGSVIGLVGLLVGIGETDLILKNIPVALISTLYGVVLANFFLTPVAEKIRKHTETELTYRRVVLEGVVALSKGTDFLRLHRKLNSLVQPEDRLEDVRLVRRIKGTVFGDAPVSMVRAARAVQVQ